MPPPLPLLIHVLLGLLSILLPIRRLSAVLLLSVTILNYHSPIFLGIASFPSIRLLVIIVLIRLGIKKQLHFTWKRIDTLITAQCLSIFIIYFLRTGTFEAANYMGGRTIDILGGYFIARSVIRGWDDVVFFLKSYVIIMIPVALGMLYESRNHFNLFSYLGAPAYSYIRNGRYRCEAAFANSILAGSFGAIGAIMAFPIILYSSRAKVLMSLALLAGIVIVYTSSSSGPVMVVFYGYFALFMWKYREKISAIRTLSVLLIIGLALFMKAPIWYLISRLSDVLGGTGWHRAYLLDQAFSHFHEWWLAGTDITGHWMPYTLEINNQADITNHFLAQGVDGGILSLVLFVCVIGEGFKSISRGLRVGFPLKHQFLIWSLGCCLFGHTTNFFSISYFDASRVLFAVFLGVIAIFNEYSEQVVNAGASMSDDSLIIAE